FCVSVEKGPAVRALAGAYEREAIRQHALGRFADMLMAVETHPAMLIYLDNARSIGPDSVAGRNRGVGLNENLAREILELHTLARHFIADAPPHALVERLAKRFRDTDGDLKELAKALVAAPEAWASARGKLKRPAEWLVASLRATGVRPSDVRPIIQAQAMLG